MAGFSLGGGRRGSEEGGENEQQHQHAAAAAAAAVIPPDSLFLFGGGTNQQPDISYPRGFELWQHHHHPQLPSSAAAAAALIGFSSDHQLPAGRIIMRGGGGGGRSGGAAAAGSSGGGGGGGVSCQDCGNQAKKDCAHMRCRTCCKSRGFQCPTHVKSTWVPASKRRERQQHLAAAAAALHNPRRPAAAAPDTSKRPREICPRPAATSAVASAGMEGVSFPAEVSSPAVFRCVRVSTMDEAAAAAEDELAYQTAVRIGGHVFRGILYDQGPEPSSSTPPAAALAAAAAAVSGSMAAGPSAVASAGMLDAPNLSSSSLQYPTPLSAFMAGTQFFPHHPRP
ncbi:Protein SHORT INTERNODES [Ananas comosus]|uniref:Protein SHORT INTERNODES n=1 Tax=Ananas comosus TaxID=4615 RepID=A0A199VIU6_ANACO|nr:Protein SHORT INTERNODES [Ananas comosus]